MSSPYFKLTVARPASNLFHATSVSSLLSNSAEQRDIEPALLLRTRTTLSQSVLRGGAAAVVIPEGRTGAARVEEVSVRKIVREPRISSEQTYAVSVGLLIV